MRRVLAPLQYGIQKAASTPAIVSADRSEYRGKHIPCADHARATDGTTVMRKIAGNDLLEVFALSPGESSLRFSHNPLDAMDGRGRMFLELVKAWGAMVLLGDLMGTALCDAHQTGNPMSPKENKPPKETVAAFIIRCSEVVDASYEEIERRGWLVRVPPLEDD